MAAIRRGTRQGKVMGILGYGGTGQAVAQLAKAPGMTVLIARRHRSKQDPLPDLVLSPKDSEQLLKQSDCLVVAVALTDERSGLIGKTQLSCMKSTAVLINVGRTTQGRELLGGLGPLPQPLPLLMDGAYADERTRQLALDFGWIPVVLPPRTRVDHEDYDRILYRHRNEIELLFHRLKGFRIFSRFDKLDVMFLAFLHFALIAEALPK